MSANTTAQASAYTEAIQDQLAEWNEISTWLDKAKKREMELRVSIARHFFPTPVEGVNKTLLPDGSELKVTHKINRSLDIAVLDTVMNELPPDSPFRNVGVLVEYKPALVMDGFRALPEQEALIFAQALIEKPGAPSLEVLPPKAVEPGSISPQGPGELGPAQRAAINVVARRKVKKAAAKKGAKARKK